jgi:transposase
LLGLGVTDVAMESTGVYWKSIYYLLEDDFTVLLVNAAHIKHVPGRKTDTIDSAWIAQLLAHGLLTASFVPPPTGARATLPDPVPQSTDQREDRAG